MNQSAFLLFIYLNLSTKEIMLLHIELNEYDTTQELLDAFHSIDDEIKRRGAVLTDSKKMAEDILINNLRNKTGERVFWYKKESFEGRITFVMLEAIRD